MVFSSIPAYLDPSNWQQQPSHQNGDQSNAIPQLRQHHLPPPLAQPSPTPPPLPRPPPLEQHQHQPHHVIINGDIMQAATSINSPRSMSERARIANIPIPEACLNCPRCESTNTKFCYFNNYNLTQPRHFCKTCRRYWTRGGALRSVPVGGGCRRNKRSKNTSNNNSKSSASSSSPSGSTVPSYNNRSTTTNIVRDLTRHLPQQLTLLSPLGQLSDHHVSNLNYNNFPLGDTSLELNNYQMGCNLIGGVGNSVTQNDNIEQWRLNHQLQLLGAGLNSSIMGNGLYPQIQTSSFVGETSSSHDDKPSNSMFTHQLDLTEKMEENQGLTRNLMGNPTNNNSWSGATWSDYITTRFTSSCTKNPQ